VASRQPGKRGSNAHISPSFQSVVQLAERGEQQKRAEHQIGAAGFPSVAQREAEAVRRGEAAAGRTAAAWAAIGAGAKDGHRRAVAACGAAACKGATAVPSAWRPRCMQAQRRTARASGRCANASRAAQSG
jgi:hypothetical protein